MPTETTSSDRPNNEQLVNRIKNLRMDLDGVITEIDDIRLAVTENEYSFLTLFESKKRIKEGRMWLGETLGALGHGLPPEFRDSKDDERKGTDPSRQPDITP